MGRRQGIAANTACRYALVNVAARRRRLGVDKVTVGDLGKGQ